MNMVPPGKDDELDAVGALMAEGDGDEDAAKPKADPGALINELTAKLAELRAIVGV